MDRTSEAMRQTKQILLPLNWFLYVFAIVTRGLINTIYIFSGSSILDAYLSQLWLL